MCGTPSPTGASPSPGRPPVQDPDPVCCMHEQNRTTVAFTLQWPQWTANITSWDALTRRTVSHQCKNNAVCHRMCNSWRSLHSQMSFILRPLLLKYSSKLYLSSSRHTYRSQPLTHLVIWLLSPLDFRAARKAIIWIVFPSPISSPMTPPTACWCSSHSHLTPVCWYLLPGNTCRWHKKKSTNDSS